MAFKTPSIEQLAQIADELGFSVTNDYLEDMLAIISPMAEGYRLLDTLPDELPKVQYPRTPGYRPEGDDNKYGAWAVKTHIEGKKTGKLKGREVGIKDNISVAGVSMVNGASFLDGYIPEFDATVVTRILDAGGIIAGKTVCEYLCVSGGSHTSSSGHVKNPHRPTHTTGGSSSGSGAVVAAGDVSLALGCDQGGSVRMPAAHCGIYGMKGSHGLVPFTGIMPVEASLDHCGPMTANVSDNALLLEVLSGSDGLDPRQKDIKLEQYTKALGKPVEGLKIGLIKEGFKQVNSEEDVNEKVYFAAKKLEQLGIQVDEISVPWHDIGLAIWSPIVNEGLAVNAMAMNGVMANFNGLQMTSAGKAFSRWRDQSDELADTFKVIAMFGAYGINVGKGHYYAKAQNLSRRLRSAYDKMLEDYDLLLLPTVALKARELPDANASPREIAETAFLYISNCCPFNVTGHPAMSVPCGVSEDIPIGMMLVAKHWNEAKIYSVSYAFEQAYDWKKF